MNKVKIKLSSIIVRNPKMIASDMDGETVMMSVESAEYYGLNKIGSRIWELLENKIKLEEMVSQLISEFDVEKKQCEKDTIDFLEELLQKNLIIIK